MLTTNSIIHFKLYHNLILVTRNYGKERVAVHEVEHKFSFYKATLKYLDK